MENCRFFIQKASNFVTPCTLLLYHFVSGSLFLYQIAQYQGDSLEVKESIKKVYHSTAGMEIRSYKSTGMYFMFQITVQSTSVLTKASV